MKHCRASIIPHIRAFPVNRVIANQQLLLAHAQWNAQGIFDKQQNRRCPEDVPSNDEQGARDLPADLLAITCDCSAGGEGRKGETAFCRSEDADEEAW